MFRFLKSYCLLLFYGYRSLLCHKSLKKELSNLTSIEGHNALIITSVYSVWILQPLNFIFCVNASSPGLSGRLQTRYEHSNTSRSRGGFPHLSIMWRADWRFPFSIGLNWTGSTCVHIFHPKNYDLMLDENNSSYTSVKIVFSSQYWFIWLKQLRLSAAISTKKWRH